MADLTALKQRLAALGVQVDGIESSIADDASVSEGSHGTRGRGDVASLIDRCGRAASALRHAEETTASVQHRTSAQLHRMSSTTKRQQLHPPAPGSKRAIQQPANRPTRQQTRPSAQLQAAPKPHSVTPLLPPPPPAPVGPEHMRAVVPNTPLSSVLHQYKEAEVVWAHEKAQLRRETVTQSKRATRLEQEVQRLSRQLERGALDAAALKAALKTRDEQLNDAHAKARQREDELEAGHMTSANRIAALEHECEDLKALLLATLQRLEAVGEVVQRADVTSGVMERKVAELEHERQAALEAAAQARAEVQDLSENRRRLAWQSKLLERMSEMQLQHNRQKTEAIKQLLDTGGTPPPGGGEAGRSGRSHGVDDEEDDLSVDKRR